MKYYLGKIFERNGDIEYTDKYLFTCRGSPARYADKVAREWRGCTKHDWDEDVGGYWASENNLVKNDGYIEVPKEEYEVLKWYISFL